jgi:hypothetical protein
MCTVRLGLEMGEENPCAVGSGRAVEIWPGYPLRDSGGWTFDRDPRVTIDSQ